MGFILMLAICLIVSGLIFVITGYGIGCDPLWFLNLTKITLTDFEDDKSKSRLIRRNGKMYAYVYPMTRVGKVELLPDGTTRGLSYIRRWERK
jgi:hypothetical protein